MPSKLPNNGLLCDSRVYLSGPMDFVASREEEKNHGWRNRVGEFLKAMGVTVFDPWFKPEVRGLHEYGREGETTTEQRQRWTYLCGKEGAQQRSDLAGSFWPAMHVDLRMVDTSDFVVAYCPTNVYSVGTPHEIITARQQRKPVLQVSPRVTFPALEQLRGYLANDPQGLSLLAQLENEVPIKENPEGAPSLWYMPLIGGEHFFDGFGFAEFRDEFNWPTIRLDKYEEDNPPAKPLLRFLVGLNQELPKRWDHRERDFVTNDDWLLWDMTKDEVGAEVTSVNLGAIAAKSGGKQ